MGTRRVLLLLCALIALGTAAKCPRRQMSPVREILCYTPTFDPQLLADSVCSCTTLVHQSHDVRNFSVSAITDLRKALREMHPSLQFVISIYDPATTLKTSAMTRQEAIARIVAALKEVDGVEMNVTAGSKERLYNFIKGLKDEMIRKSYDKRILVALPGKSEDIAKQFDLKELVKYVDLFTLPTDYLTDEDGAFVTFHPSRLMGLFDMLNSDSMVDLISGLGVPKRNILMTLPANGYKFTLKEETDNTPRSRTTERDPTPIDRKELCEAINGGEWTVERDEDLTAPYAFQNKTWIAFEDKISVGIKGKYALLRDLAGLALRNIENDIKTECERPLTQEIYQSFTEFKRKSRQAVLNALEDELHQTQFSYPNQARTSNYRVVRVVDTEGRIRAVRENTQTEFICRRQGYFVHPKSCNRFYRCVKFNQRIEDYSVFEFDCPAGLSFDERTEVCVWPGSLPQGSPCPGSSEIAPVAPKRFECTAPGYYADPGNCRWFFACMDLGASDLMAFEFRCPYGLVFDEKKLVCEWPWLVPACSGSSYTRAEYDYRGASTIGVGGYVTGKLPEYSVAGTDYSNVGYTKTTKFSDYTGSVGRYGGSVSTNTGYTAGKTSNTVYSTGYSGYSDGTANIGSFGGIATGFSASTAGQYSGTVGGNHLTNAGATYSGIHRPSYTDSAAGKYTGSASTNNLAGASYSETSGTNYFGSTGILPGSNVHTSSVGPYGKSTDLYTGSRANGYSSSSNVYSETGHQASSFRPSFGSTGSYSRPSVDNSVGITQSTNREYTAGSTAGIYGSIGAQGVLETTDKIHAGYTETGSNVQGSTSSARVSEINFNSGTLGISTVPGHGVTSADNSYFISGSVPASGATGASSTGYENKGEYTASVLVHPRPIYPLTGTTTTTDVRDYAGTVGTSEINVSHGYGRTDSTRPSLNISIFGSQVPIGYDIRKGSTGTILNGNGVEVASVVNDAIFNREHVPGTVSTVISQGSILTGEAQPGYVATSSGIPGYVITDGIKTVESGGSDTLIYATPTPTPISLSSPSISGVVLKGDATPNILLSGQTTPGVSIGGVQLGTYISESSTGKPYVSQSGIYYDTGSVGSATYSADTQRVDLAHTSQNYKTDEGRGTVAFNYDANRYSANDIPDYRPTSAILPDSIVPAGKIDTNVHGSTLINVQDSSAAAQGYPKLPVSTPSGFTKTGPTRTGITTAILGGGGSFSVTTSERRPILNPDNISEKAFEGNVGYTKSSSNFVDSSAFSTPSGYSSTVAPVGRITPQSGTSGYSYPKPTVSFETSGATFSSTPVTPVKNYLPASEPTPVLNVEVSNGSRDNTDAFGSKVFTTPAYRGSSTPISIVYTTEYPKTYKTTLFEAAKIPTVSTVRPIIDTGYKTVITPTNTPVSILTDNEFTQRTSGIRSQTASGISTSNIGLGVSFQRTDDSSQNNYGVGTTSPSPPFGYLPAKSNKPDAITSTVRYDEITARPDTTTGAITYKKPLPGSDIVFESFPSVVPPTTFRPSIRYYPDQGFTTPSSVGTASDRGGSPMNLDISKDKIDKLITNYDRGTVKYTTSVYDNSEFGSTSTKRLPSSTSPFAKPLSSVNTGGTFAVTTPIGPTIYEVTTKPSESKGKVIVKWSDLHPLLLGKLGAECTCKADPFGTLRGPVRKLIDSSKGKVDLANYDESELYVDLENGSYDGSYEEGDYNGNLPQPFKISLPKSVTTNSPDPLSLSYLPVSSTTIGTPSEDLGGSAKFQAGFRTGKKLDNIGPLPNSFASYEEENDPDQIIDGATDCARPGLFRHPGLCNKFYACYWDQWKKKFTLHIFNCPIHLTFDLKAGACNWPSKGPACQADNLLI